MANSDAASEDELPLAVRRKAKKRKRGPKKAPVKRIRKKKVRNLPAEKPIECPECGLRFHFLSKLKDHQRHHTGEKPYECDECHKSFSQSYSLRTHKLIHSNEKPFKCNFCAYACRDSSTLRKHHYRHMGIVQKYNCKMCAKSFTLKYMLKNHVAEAHLSVDLRTHRCEQCDKKFKTKAQVKLHVKLVHDRIRATACPVCNKFLSNSGNLKTHLMSHVQEKPYLCDYPGCGKSYKDKGTLVKHSKVHTREKQYSCSECGYRFTRPGRLRNHMVKVHQRTKCVECDHCGQKFYSKNYLIIHIGRKHDPRRNHYICDVCGYRAKNKPGMVMHVKFVHNGIRNDVHCNLCRKTYKKHEYLKIHYKRTHNIAYKTNQAQKLEDPFHGNVKIKTEPIDSDDEALGDLQIKVNDAADQTGKDDQTTIFEDKDLKGIEIKGRITNTDQTGRKRGSKKVVPPSQATPPRVHKCDICGRFFKKLPRLKNHLVKVHARSKCVSCELCGKKFYSKNYLIDHMYKRHMQSKEYVCDECGFKTHHKPGIAVHIKFAHATTAVQCDICKKKYKRLELLQFHYSEAHNTPFDITTNTEETPVKNANVKMESLNMEMDAIDLFEIEKHEIADRSLTRDGTTSLKGLIERSGVRSVPDNVFGEFCSGHIEYLPAGGYREKGASYSKVPRLGVTDKRLEAQAASNINKLVAEARKRRAKEGLESARQMYNERMKRILEAKEKAKLQRLNRKNVKQVMKDESANEPNDKEKVSHSETNISISDDDPVTTLVDASDVANPDDEGTKDIDESDVAHISDLDDETDTQLAQQVVKPKVGEDNLLTLLEEISQLTKEPDTSNGKEVYLEGKETTVEDVLTGGSAENDSNNESYIEEWLDETVESADDTDERASKNKDKNNGADVEIESNVKETTNEPDLVEDETNKSTKTESEISSGESPTKIKKVLYSEHDYAKSEMTRQIELELLQCPEKLFDKSFDSSEEDHLHNLERHLKDVAINGGVTLLDIDNDKPQRRKQRLELKRDDIPTPSPQKKVKKKPNKKRKKDECENVDSTTALILDSSKRPGQRRRKQKLQKRGCTDQDKELPLMTQRNRSKGGKRRKTKPKAFANNECPNTEANNELGDNISVNDENNTDNDANAKDSNEKINQKPILSFKYKVLVEEVLRSINDNLESKPQDLNKEIALKEMERSVVNKEFIALLIQTQEAANENKEPDDQKIQDPMIIDKLKDIASSQSSNYNSLVAEVLKTINGLISEKSDNDPSSKMVNSEVNARNSVEKHLLLSQENTSNNDNNTSKIEEMPNSSTQNHIRRKRKNFKWNKRKQSTSNTRKKSDLAKCNEDNKTELSNKVDSTNRGIDSLQEEHVTAKRRGRKRKIKTDQNDNNDNNIIIIKTDNDQQKDGSIKRSSRKRKLNRKYFEDSDDQSNEASDVKHKKSEGCTSKDKAKSSGKVIFNTHQCYVCFKVFETKEALIEHCKTHFNVDRQKSLKKCPLCEFTCTAGFSRHMKKVHDVSIKIPYARIQEETDGVNTKYYFEINDPKIKRVDVIPSVKNLNRRAMLELDKEHREKNDKTIAKHKLVKKGNEWVIEKEELSLDGVVMPEFDKNIDISDKISDRDDYFDSLKKLYHVSKKAGKKMMFPCKHCDKICQNLAALKLHNRKHVANPAPFAPKIWKHKLANPKYCQNRKVTPDKKAKAKKRKPAQNKLKGVDKTNIEDVLQKDNRKAKPKPIKNNHRCDPQLQEFYRNNIRGGDIEFWQFLKIYNKMDRDNIKDFKDLEGKYNYGIIDTDTQREILEDNFILQVGNCNEENVTENNAVDEKHEAKDFGNDRKESRSSKSKGRSNISKIKNQESVKEIGIDADLEREMLEENYIILQVGNDVDDDGQVVRENADMTQEVKKFSKEERKKRAQEIANEVMQHSQHRDS